MTFEIVRQSLTYVRDPIKLENKVVATTGNIEHAIEIAIALNARTGQTHMVVEKKR